MSKVRPHLVSASSPIGKGWALPRDPRVLAVWKVMDEAAGKRSSEREFSFGHGGKKCMAYWMFATKREADTAVKRLRADGFSAKTWQSRAD